MEKQTVGPVNLVCGRRVWPVFILNRVSGMGNRAQIINVSGSCSIVGCGEALEIRTAMSAGSSRETMADPMPPVVRTLSPPAKTCHHLPRCVIFSCDAWRSALRRKNEARKGCIPMSRTRPELWRIDDSMRTEMRSISSDLLLENGLEGLQSPVTACHIATGDWRSVPWRAPSGLDGSFRHLFPGRCPGLSSTAPLVLKRVVLKRKTCGRRFSEVRDLRRTDGGVRTPHRARGRVERAARRTEDRITDRTAVYPLRTETSAEQPHGFFRPEGALYRSPGQRPGFCDTIPFPKPCRGALGLGATFRPQLRGTISGLDGSFRNLFSRRCPGQLSTAPLVLMRKTCGRRFGGVGDPRRTAPNGRPLDSIKATDWQRKPTGRRHLATTDDRIVASVRKLAAMFYGAGDGRPFKEILLKKISGRDLRRLVGRRCSAQLIPAS